MDKIHIKNLEVFARHGVFPEENALGQKFVVSAVLYTSTREAGRADDLAKSIHYGEVSRFITEFMEQNTFQLLETAAERLAEELLLNTERLEKIRLEIKKPWAPVGLPLETVSVEIERGWHTAYIALGSNLGDKEANLRLGVEGLRSTRGCRVEAVSGLLFKAAFWGGGEGGFPKRGMEERDLPAAPEPLGRAGVGEKEGEGGRPFPPGAPTSGSGFLFFEHRRLY